jgi:transcriptional regulator with XRE-family HTH domain
MSKQKFSALCKRLQQLRTMRGESILDMAKKLRMKTSDLSNIEYGLIPVPEGFVDRLESSYGLTYEEVQGFNLATQYANGEETTFLRSALTKASHEANSISTDQKKEII